MQSPCSFRTVAMASGFDKPRGPRYISGMSGLTLLTDNKIPGTSGAASVRRYLVEGWQTLIF